MKIARVLPVLAVLAAAAPAAASDYPWAPEPAAVPLPASIAVTVAPPAYDWGQPPASIPIIASAPDDSADALQAPSSAGTATYPGADYAWAQPAAGIVP